MDWKQFLQNPDVYETMEVIAYKRFYDELLAQEAFLYCTDKLREGDFKKLKQYTGQNGASQKTFFCRVYRNLVEDFAKSKLGACTPPTWIERLGSFWKKLFKQLCCHSVDKEKIVAKPEVFYIDENAESEDELIFPEDLSSAIDIIKLKDPKCLTRGKKTVSASLDDEENAHVANELTSESLEGDIDASEFEKVLHALTIWLKQDQNIDCSENQLLQDLQKIQFSKSVDEHNRIIVLLRLHFQEQMKLPAAAEIVGMEAHTARRRKDTALELIQSVFVKNGISQFSL